MDANLTFTADQLNTVNEAVAMAEELVSDAYKMSASQWLKRRFDVKTRQALSPEETVQGPFAQVIRYEGRQRAGDLNSRSFDFYKICLQDHAILEAVDQNPGLQLFPLVLYVVAHELIHIVRFSTFQQSFDATEDERLAEEARVHAETHRILSAVGGQAMSQVLVFFSRWRHAIDDLLDS